MVDGDVFRMSEAADAAEVAAARVLADQQNTVLQRSLPRPLPPLLRDVLPMFASEDDKADTDKNESIDDDSDDDDDTAIS